MREAAFLTLPFDRQFMEAKRTESTSNVLKPRTNDKQNMAQVMLTTTDTTPIAIASPKDAPVAMSDKPDHVSTDSIAVKIADTLETLSLSGTGKDQTGKSDEPEDGEKASTSNNVDEQVLVSFLLCSCKLSTYMFRLLPMLP